jgi:hypothetical protein
VLAKFWSNLTARRAVILALPFMIMLFFATAWALDKSFSYRYRLIVTAEVDGKEVSASSVIEVRFQYPTFGTYEFFRYFTFWSGTTPILDLGDKGFLMPAFYYHSEEWVRHGIERQAVHKQANTNGPPPKTPEPHPPWVLLMGAYKATEPQDVLRKTGRVEIPSKYYPVFAWVPYANTTQGAKQIVFDEIAKRGPSNVRIVSLHIEPAPQAVLQTQINPPPRWLEEARNRGITHHDPNVYLLRPHALECKECRT